MPRRSPKGEGGQPASVSLNASLFASRQLAALTAPAGRAKARTDERGSVVAYYDDTGARQGDINTFDPQSS
ncbi:hypothetical protein [Hyphobacterium sp.]|uniref:hypothetical protein n=1 Tax=Hyphobacterium sp. TaxID=2004662 RepID=UPI003BAD1A98